MTSIPAVLRRAVIARAGNRCEYCRLAQEGQEASFHIDHIVPESAGGVTTMENCALACVSCSLRKGARENAIDPMTSQIVRIFNPRLDEWANHFTWDDTLLRGVSPIGRGTIELLKLNRTLILAIRSEEKFQNRHP
jgi:hypothetical protein